MTIDYNPSTKQSSYFSLDILSKDFNMAFKNTMIILLIRTLRRMTLTMTLYK